MEIKVIGKRTGISKKSGKEYLQVGYLAPAVNGVGEFGDSLFLDPSEYKYEEIAIGKKYNAEFNRQGFLQSFKPL
ncbi:MAG: hypothetical protein E7422_05330 [Ruminococcaceae bacterium]|nr:hypothetical protein [Oscillospiraceae bacterium]